MTWRSWTGSSCRASSAVESTRRSPPGCRWPWRRPPSSIDVLLWEVPPTARKPDAMLHRCIPDGEQLMAQHVLITVEVLSTWSARRDRVHKMSDYADAGIPHYWLVAFDKVGAVTIERYALAGAGGYVHVGTSHRDMGPVATKVSAPFPIEIFWADIEVAPRV